VDEPTQHGVELLALYDRAVAEVYAYLRARCGNRQLAEDLTADTFLAAVGQIRRGAVEQVTVAWLIGIARHKLIDHWRRAARRLEAEPLPDEAGAPVTDEPWDVVIDRHRVGSVMASIGPHHASALTLRYLDDLSVPDVARCLGRTVHATEALLVRARSAFRTAYEGSER
jgi:RNA polymerase sigma-70 factor, ECF subfamily